MKKALIIAILGTQILAACTAGEWVAGAIGVGVGVGASRYYDRHHRHHRHHHHGGGWYGYSTEADALAADNDARTFAEKHHVSLAAAKKIQTAFLDLPDKGLAAFASIGLGKADLKAITNRDLPSAEGIKSMAAKLDMSEAQTRDLLLSVNRDFEVQASNVNSTYWQSCMKDGEWKTPQNSFCEQTSWNGCSPQTGASMCY
jgi:hypothetical protein